MKRKEMDEGKYNEDGREEESGKDEQVDEE